MDVRALCRACGAWVAISITGSLVAGHDHDVAIPRHPDDVPEPGTYRPGEIASVGASEPVEDYLLQESGFRFMLEDGSGFLLLESSPEPGSRQFDLSSNDAQDTLRVVLPPAEPA